MHRLRNSTVAAIVGLILGTGAAQACQGSTVLFEDDFALLKDSWDVAPEDVKIEDNRMILSPKANDSLWVPNTAAKYGDVDMCVDVSHVQADEPGNAYAGLIFWYVDDDNYYAAEVNAAAEVSVWREQRGKLLQQIEPTKVANLHIGEGATNQLRVVITGQRVAIYVNGEKFRDIAGVLPGEGEEVGVITDAPEKSGATFGFSNFKITKPE